MKERGAISPGVAITLVVIFGLLTSLFVPAYLKYLKKTKTTEASANVRIIYDGQIAYYNEIQSLNSPYIDCVNGTRKLIRKLRPEESRRAERVRFVAAEREPPFPKPKAQPGDWNQPSWKALGFRPQGPTLYAYEAVAAGSGLSSSFTARAIGDLDGDGVTSLFERVASVGDCPIGEVDTGSGLYSKNELE